MFDTLSTVSKVSSFVTNAVATYAIQKGVDSVINNEETFKKRLKKVLFHDAIGFVSRLVSWG